MHSAAPCFSEGAAAWMERASAAATVASAACTHAARTASLARGGAASTAAEQLRPAVYAAVQRCHSGAAARESSARATRRDSPNARLE